MEEAYSAKSVRGEQKEVDYSQYVVDLARLKGKAPEVAGVPTGTKLDELFFTVSFDERSGKRVRKPLGGNPRGLCLTLLGFLTPERVFAEQFAVF